MSYPDTINRPGSPVVRVTSDGRILPTQKSGAIAALLESIAGVSRESDVCALCHSERVGYDDFVDDLSRIEFAISRMCQGCQNDTFGGDDE